jgi:hypothetical protein
MSESDRRCPVLVEGDDRRTEAERPLGQSDVLYDMVQAQRKARLCVHRKMYVIVHAGWAAGIQGATSILVRLHGQNAGKEDEEQDERGSCEEAL